MLLRNQTEPKYLITSIILTCHTYDTHSFTIEPITGGKNFSYGTDSSPISLLIT